MNIRKFIVAVGVGLCIGACSAFAALWIRAQWFKPKPADLLHVNVSVLNFEASTLLVVARDQHFFEKYGLDVALRTDAQVISEEYTLLQKEQTDVVVGTDYGFVSNVSLTTSTTILASIGSKQSVTRIIARKNAGITRITDIRGKKIGVPENTIASFQAGLFLGNNNIPLTDVTFVYVSPDALGRALSSGEVDAVAIWDPIATMIEQQLGNSVVSWNSTEEATNLLLITDHRLTQYPEHIQGLLRALIDAEIYTKSHAKEAQASVVSAFNLSPAYVADIWQWYDFSVSLPQEVVVRMENQFDWMMRHQLLPPHADKGFYQSFDARYLKSIDPNRVSLIQ
ncbi:ABC transporter substrate-binding protein [Patescibacteria group bacterium]|nr:ABC transporter substrate-binding protein [Patescibacteria group bacterium]